MESSEQPALHKLAVFRKQFYGFLFAVPFLVIFAMFFIYPFFSGIAVSFTNRKGEWIGFQNYYNILFNTEFVYQADFLRGLGNTLLFVAISVPLLIVIPLFIAILLDIKPVGYKFFRRSY